MCVCIRELKKSLGVKEVKGQMIEKGERRKEKREKGTCTFLPFLLKIISVLKVFKVFKVIKDNNANLLLPPFPPSSLFSLHHHLSFNFFNSP